jgi:hypothetical protein
MTLNIQTGNYAAGTLSGPVAPGDTSITFVVTSPGFSFPTLTSSVTQPMQHMYLTLADAATSGSVTREIVKVTGPTSAVIGSITYTIERAQEGTSAQTFALGDLVQLRPTKKTLIEYSQQGAPIGWWNVEDFFAVHDGVTDDTDAVQAAIDAAYTVGGGLVYCPPGNYLFDGVLTLKSNVRLHGFLQADSDAWKFTGGGPIQNTTFSITNEDDTFINADGRNCMIDGIMFWYPNQVVPSSSVPVVYPYTVTSPVGDFRIENCTLINPYNGIDLEQGRQYLRNLRIGAIVSGINIREGDEGIYMDTITISTRVFSDFYDQSSYPFPDNLNDYSAANGTAISIGRAEHISFNNLSLFWIHTGIEFIDQAGFAPTSGFGTINDLFVRDTVYGVICQSTDTGSGTTPGVIITNFTSLAEHPAVGSIAAIWMKTGGNAVPHLSIVNGSILGTYSTGAYKIDSGMEGLLNISDVRGVHIYGSALTAPAVPSTTVALTNPFPFRVQVAIAGGTITVVAINGVNIGATTFEGPYILTTAGTITLTYSVAPTWKWFAA